ncbi:MAG: carboxypeptidase-like regulatory domain-containing protein [Bacteroidota bacterium]
MKTPPTYSRFIIRLLALCIILAPAGNAWSQITIDGYIVDQSNSQPLAFVQVFSAGGQGTLSNEEGYFMIKVPRLPAELQFQNIGYENLSIKLTETENLLIQLNPVSYQLNEVQIASKESKLPYKKLWASVAKTRRALLGREQGKLFLRSQTMVDQNMALEQLEAYYNYYIANGEIDSLTLKAGNLRLPESSYFMNQGLPFLIRNYKPISEAQSLMPSSPYDLSGWRNIRRWYRVRIVEKIPTASDTLMVYKFEAKDPQAVFSGTAYIQQSNDVLQELRLHITDSEQIPFYSLANQSEDALDQLSMEIRIAFEGDQRNLRYRLMTYDLQYRIAQARQIHTIASLWFFKSGSLFPSPILPIDPPLEEYEKLAYFPYDSVFWQRQPQIPLSSTEQAQSATLYSTRPYDMQQDSGLALMSNRIEYWYPDWQLDTLRVSKTPSLEAKYNILEKSSLAYEYDSIYASTQLFLDYDCYPDTVIYQIEAVIDYEQSYLIPRDSLSLAFFDNYLKVTRFHANRMQAMLQYRFGNECPDPKAIADMYDEVDQTRRQDIANYFANLNKKRPKSFKLKISKIISDRLSESERFANEVPQD